MLMINLDGPGFRMSKSLIWLSRAGCGPPVVCYPSLQCCRHYNYNNISLQRLSVSFSIETQRDHYEEEEEDEEDEDDKGVE